MEGLIKKGKVKAVLFDYNGVIINDLDAVGRAECETIKQLGGQPLSIKYWFKNISQDWQRFYIEHGVKPENLHKTGFYMNKFYPKYWQYVRLTPHIKVVLRKLKEENIKVGIFSAQNRKLIKDGLKRLSLTDYFSFVIAAEDVVRQKPDINGVIKALKLFKVKSSEMLYIDDMPTIFGQLHHKGIPTVGFYSRVSGDLSLADVRIRDIRRILRYI